MAVNYKIIGERIKEFRLMNHMTQAELAERIDICNAYMNKIEKAKNKASLEILLRIAGVFDITVDCLLIGSQNNSLNGYAQDYIHIFSECTSGEQKIIYDVLSAIKKSLLENRASRLL